MEQMSLETSLKNPRSGCAIGLLAFGILCGLGIAALGGLLISLVPDAWREMHEVWTETPGVIVGRGVKPFTVRTGSGPSTYRTTVTYPVVLDCKYEVGGKEYVGRELVAPKQAVNKSNEEEAIRAAASYSAGEAIPVYYNPEDPQHARLEGGGPNGLFWLGVIFGPIVLLGGVGLAWWVWLDWKSKARGAA